jgi:hypothetical protein
MLFNTLADSIKAIPFGSRNFTVQCTNRGISPSNSLLGEAALNTTVGANHCFFVSDPFKITKNFTLNILAIIHSLVITVDLL